MAPLPGAHLAEETRRLSAESPGSMTPWRRRDYLRAILQFCSRRKISRRASHCSCAAGTEWLEISGLRGADRGRRGSAYEPPGLPPLRLGGGGARHSSILVSCDVKVNSRTLALRVGIRRCARRARLSRCDLLSRPGEADEIALAHSQPDPTRNCSASDGRTGTIGTHVVSAQREHRAGGRWILRHHARRRSTSRCGRASTIANANAAPVSA